MSDLTPPPRLSGKSLLDRVEDALLPLINLVFLLLMFFIVAGQLSETPLPELPGTQSQQADTGPEADLIVTRTGEWQVQGNTYDRQSLIARLPDPSPEQPLRIGASGQLTMADLETLMRLLEEHGYQDILLLTEPQT